MIEASNCRAFHAESARRADGEALFYRNKSDFFTGIDLAMNFSELGGREMRLWRFDLKQPKVNALLLKRFMSAAIHDGWGNKGAYQLAIL